MCAVCCSEQHTAHIFDLPELHEEFAKRLPYTCRFNPLEVLVTSSDTGCGTNKCIAMSSSMHCFVLLPH